MELVGVITSFLLIVHGGILVYFNMFRVRKTIEYINDFRGNILSEADYKDLKNRYTSFFSYLEPYPNDERYKILYTNYSFCKFVNRGKIIFKYLFIALPSLLIILLLMSLISSS